MREMPLGFRTETPERIYDLARKLRVEEPFAETCDAIAEYFGPDASVVVSADDLSFGPSEGRRGRFFLFEVRAPMPALRSLELLYALLEERAWPMCESFSGTPDDAAFELRVPDVPNELREQFDEARYG